MQATNFMAEKCHIRFFVESATAASLPAVQDYLLIGLLP